MAGFGVAPLVLLVAPVAVVYYNKNLFDQAIEAFTNALKLAPDDRDAQQGLAEATKARDALKAEFDAVLLPGGALNADKLRMETKAS